MSTTTGEQIVKQITIGSESRYIAAKYDIYGKEIKVDDYETTTNATATKTELETKITTDIDTAKNDLEGKINTVSGELSNHIMDANTTFLKKSELATEINNISDQIKIEADISKQMVWIENIMGYKNIEIGRDNHFIITFVESDIQDETHKVKFYINGQTEELTFAYYAVGAKIEIFNNTAVFTNNLGNVLVRRAPESSLNYLAIGDIPGTARMSILVFREESKVSGFTEMEEGAGDN